MLIGDKVTVAARSTDSAMGRSLDRFDLSVPLFAVLVAILCMLVLLSLFWLGYISVLRTVLILLGMALCVGLFSEARTPAAKIGALNSSIIQAVSILLRLRGRQICGLSAVAVCLAAAPATAFSAPQVSGSAKNLSINAQNSSVEDVLSALRENFNLRFQSSVILDKKLTGTYRGSLLEVVWRLLEGHDFIVESNEDQLEVVVLRAPKRPAESEAADAREVSIIPCNPEKLADDLKSCFGKSGFSDVILGGCIRNATVIREGFMTCQMDHEIQQNYDRCSAEQQIATMRMVGSKLNLYRPRSCGFG